ncbi:unnamed protein product [Cuscuta campestris]|uniref:protein-serine/threonine phosphatase n=2 Tax=Cuscuta sect. Cleistogrammica TaxID=1824901 RepID=A0A484LAP8_9ASTE|nr:hypothetical protein DM860_016808 [Cuscuta australis]VFQ73373.1 unnamed protein product [Cuscuta campestris]
MRFSSMFNGLARSLTLKKGRSSSDDGRCSGIEAVEAMAKAPKKTDLVLRSSGTLNVEGSRNASSVFSKRGEKGINQDRFIIWEEFGGQEDMLFCGIFDGHGPWGHFVAKMVRDSMPSTLLCSWQDSLAEASVNPDFCLDSDKLQSKFNIWKSSYLKACAAVDQELEHHPKIDSFYSGTTALTVIRQGEAIYIANVGDSRAVLATHEDGGNLAAVQLTVDLKPNLPQEAERIMQCNGRVFCLHDEPGVYRVWLPDVESPGLAMSRAIGDYCVKHFGLISVPDVTHRHITSRDQFLILATDGVWDVISNQEAVRIVSETPDRGKAAKRLVECAGRTWKRARKGIAMDDISAIVIFFGSSPSCGQTVRSRQQ